MRPVCPFVKAAPPEESKNNSTTESDKRKETTTARDESSGTTSTSISAKCPFGYDSQTFKLGPFSCMMCQSLLFESTKCIPCFHVYCKVCISQFHDCPLCGADIKSLESHESLQATVDRFIEGHARIKRGGSTPSNDKVLYEDASLERGTFLVQQAMRAFRALNLESAHSRLSICAEDIRSQLETESTNWELCSQLGAVLGMLGDCSKAKGEASEAIKYFEESLEFLEKIPNEDAEITHTMSVSLNKIGDLKYYAGDLEAAKRNYVNALGLRRKFLLNKESAPSQAIDVAISLAKVADVDRSIGNEDAAGDGFREAIRLLETLKIKSENVSLYQKKESVMEFLRSQVEGVDRSEV